MLTSRETCQVYETRPTTPFCVLDTPIPLMSHRSESLLSQRSCTLMTSSPSTKPINRPEYRSARVIDEFCSFRPVVSSHFGQCSVWSMWSVNGRVVCELKQHFINARFTWTININHPYHPGLEIIQVILVVFFICFLITKCSLACLNLN